MEASLTLRGKLALGSVRGLVQVSALRPPRLKARPAENVVASDSYSNATQQIHKTLILPAREPRLVQALKPLVSWSVFSLSSAGIEHDQGRSESVSALPLDRKERRGQGTSARRRACSSE